MVRKSGLWGFLLASTVIAAIALLPGCGRTPEDSGSVPPVDQAAKPGLELSVLDLPQENSVIGISLNALPRGLVATYNDERAIEIADESRPELRYTFDADLPDSPGRSPRTIAEFEVLMAKLTDGGLTDSGSTETALGAATWASGTYSADGESFGDVRVFVPHPSGAGTLILYAVCPEGVATVEERLASMREILSKVS